MSLDLEELNTSELLLLAREFIPNTPGGLPRDILIEIALGQIEDELDLRPIDKTRLKIMEFVNDHWEQIRPLVQCPARTRSPRACFNCTDMQVVECADLNKQHLDEGGD